MGGLDLSDARNAAQEWAKANPRSPEAYEKADTGWRTMVPAAASEL